jgi:FAD/FMN-containing dehydrogenase
MRCGPPLHDRCAGCWTSTTSCPADHPILASYDSVRSFDASISAEHGLGQSRAGIIGDYKDAYELQLMRGVKELFDPAGLMNPGKVVPNA